GVIHRDLKGQNVVLGDYGEVLVLDWGFAKIVGEHESTGTGSPGPEADAPTASLSPSHTQHGAVMGTPAYMAPEQADGRHDLIDPPPDVYGLGAILYEILTGRPPFPGTKTAEVLRQVREEEPARPRQVHAGVSRSLEAICLRALAKNPANRYA